jgi:hypothetical integral membrane protein (TIGR02206 family)
MIQHEIIPPLSIEWWIYNVISIITIIAIILIGQKLSLKNKRHLTFGIASLFIFEFFFMDWYHVYTGVWSVKDSLPLHLCGIMWVVTIYMLLTKKQWAFEMMLFIGMPGGVHSLLTPELTHGNSLLHKIDFFVGHGGLVLAPFYAIYVLNMWPRKSAWWKSFIKLQILVLVAAFANYIFESNYMYLAYPPIAENPLIPPENSFFGKWPYYILIFEIAVLAHAMLINLPFWTKSRRNI